MGVDPNMMPLALATLALMVPWLYDGSLLIKREQPRAYQPTPRRVPLDRDEVRQRAKRRL